MKLGKLFIEHQPPRQLSSLCTHALGDGNITGNGGGWVKSHSRKTPLDVKLMFLLKIHLPT